MKKFCYIAMLAAAVAFPAQADNAQPLEEFVQNSILETISSDEVNLFSLSYVSPQGKEVALRDITDLQRHIAIGDVVETESVAVDERMRRFVASVLISPADEQKAPLRGQLIGRYDALSLVPVLGHSMQKGETIHEEDLSWEAFPERLVRSQHVTSKDDLVGMVLTRNMQDGKVMSHRYVEKRKIFKKGDVAALIYRTPTMEMKMTVDVLESGSVGDVITVRNRDSDRMVMAQVTDKGELLVNYQLQEQAMVN